MMKFMRWAFPALVIAGGVLVGAPAAAQAVSTIVYYNDLDVASPSGLATLHQRIDRAVTTVCGSDASGGTLREAQNIRNCRKGALRNAQLQLAFAANQTRRVADREGAVVIASR